MIRSKELVLIRKVVELGTVTAAAVEVGQSQPAASATLNNLENRLGFKLFNRTGRAMTLTRQGAELYPQIISAIAASEAVESAARNLRHGLPARLAIGSVAVAGVTLVPAALKHLTADHQDIQTTILSGTTRDLVRMTAEEQLDIAVILGDPGDERVSVYPLGQVGLHAVMPADHAYAAAQTLTIDALAKERMILLRPELPVGALAGKHLDLGGIAYSNAIRVSQSVVACELVELQAGIAVLEHLSASYARRRGLHAVPLQIEERLSLTLITSKNADLTGSIGVVAKLLQDEACRLGVQPAIRKSV
ncbi:LysR family transcriptional regulator (plasmid) [Agrobacterium salinitolerans]|uniref:LysR family transcriptional regulator n=1 Tax=Agrobacterium salinitolerans TaxID=1183413 RepID=UPI0013AF00E4|nr:LysR family transcriptional regulator [Agrobacterium salinitolerans]QXC52326.1 LysR family transcriptional regulator [Agrobacterium salinitolerans]